MGQEPGHGSAGLSAHKASHKAALMVLTRAVTLSEACYPLPSSQGCWQNSFPCNDRTLGGLFLQVSRRISLNVGKASVPLLEGSSDNLPFN